MFNLFKCKHPARALFVRTDSTSKDSDNHPGEFTIITHHLYCMKCNEQVDITYAKPHWDVMDVNIRKELKKENKL